MLDPDREVYPNAPLQYVACEVRYPYHPGVVTALEGFFRVLGSDFPIVEPATETTIMIGPAGPISTPTDTKTVRFMSRDRRLAIAITPTQLIVDTTRYSRFEEFRGWLEAGLRGLSTLEIPVAGAVRIGLRYIDEVRIPGVGETVESWVPFIGAPLLAATGVTIDGHSPASTQGTIQFDLGLGHAVVMRYGSLSGRSVGDAPLAPRRPLQDGPYFLLDLDSFSAKGIEEVGFDANEVLCRVEELHSPVRDLFEASITERLREVFREVTA